MFLRLRGFPVIGRIVISVVLAVKDRAKSSVSSWYQSARLITARFVQLKIDLQVSKDWQICFCWSCLKEERRVGKIACNVPGFPQIRFA